MNMHKNDDFDFRLDSQDDYDEDAGVLPAGYGEEDLLAEFLNAPLPEENRAQPEPQENTVMAASVPDEPTIQEEPQPDFDLGDLDFGSGDAPADVYDQPEPAFQMELDPQYAPPAYEPEPPASQQPPQEPVQKPPLSRAEQRQLQKMKKRRFKELYLPAALAGISLLVILIILIGGISRSAAARKAQKEADQLASEGALTAAELEAQEATEKLAEAEKLAATYNYQGAIDVLDSFSGELTSYPELLAAKSQYSQELANVKAWSNPGDIVNLSFHVLIADPSRAFTDGNYGSSYNKNFVTIDEFQTILEQLYANGYVLVGLDDVVTKTEADDGTVTYAANTIYLPDGKTPFMLTETMVNYFKYMVDPDKDGVPDAKGAGFANKLVVTSSGDIKAQIVNADGNTDIGDYDLVPILESFIAEHPDFSYNNARAILAVCGQDGVFGYRITEDEDQVAGAKELVQALRDKGYTIACYTYNNLDYNDQTVAGIQQDMESWNAKIKPVLGSVDVMVFARGIDLSSYSDTKFDVLYTSGFRYFIGASTAPTAEITNTYFHQKRLMVTGTQMAYNSTLYTKYFNSMSILNDQRGTVPS